VPLTPLLQQIGKAVWRARELHFLPIWSTLTGVAVIGVARALSSATDLIVQEARSVPSGLAWKREHVTSRSIIVVPALLILLFAGYVAVTLIWEDFTYYDNSMFTLQTLKGHNISPPIWRDNGRFFPLGHQEFNLIRHFTNTVAGYHLLPIVQLLVLCCALLILDDELTITARASLATFALVVPSIAISFGGLIFGL
jgi:hypothetical protein